MLAYEHWIYLLYIRLMFDGIYRVEYDILIYIAIAMTYIAGWNIV